MDRYHHHYRCSCQTCRTKLRTKLVIYYHDERNHWFLRQLLKPIELMDWQDWLFAFFCACMFFLMLWLVTATVAHLII
jgi:hypothetical protein